jgi:hypothetical protein
MANSNSHAIYAVDPGNTTGQAWGVFDLREPTVSRIMKRAFRKGNLYTAEMRGSYVEQSWLIARLSTDWFFKSHVERGLIAAGGYSFVMESFSPRSLGVELISLQIISGVEVLMRGAYNIDDQEYKRYVIQQSASEAKGFCNDTMLKAWGLYTGRTPHERDALRHIARRLDAMLNHSD